MKLSIYLWLPLYIVGVVLGFKLGENKGYEKGLEYVKDEIAFSGQENRQDLVAEIVYQQNKKYQEDLTKFANQQRGIYLWRRLCGQ